MNRPTVGTWKMVYGNFRGEGERERGGGDEEVSYCLEMELLLKAISTVLGSPPEYMSE